MATWFEGSIEIECSIQEVMQSLENLGAHFVGITKLMPGITAAELLEQEDNSVIIKTNEGVMKRTNISVVKEKESLTVEFDEEYQAGPNLTGKSHYRDKYKTSGAGIIYFNTISNVEASGLLGFFYRMFGSSNIGKAVLNSNKAFFEQKNP